MTKEEFIRETEKRGLLLDEDSLRKLDVYACLLKEYNEKVNLTAITEYEEILDKHFLDSLLGFFGLKMEGSLADIGTGAGFPGVVLKICYPKLKVTLVEPIKKRCVFLKELIEKLDLKDIEIVNERGEDLSLRERERFDYVTARAVSDLSILIEVCGALVRKEGYFVALRGANGHKELDKADKAIRKMGFEAKEIKDEELSDGSKRVIGYLQKMTKTPKTFPRKYSIIKQKPL